MLDVRDLHAGYGRMEILHGLDLHVDAEEIVSLIGANGAGKTTTLRALAGMVSTDAGHASSFDGRAHRTGCALTRSCADGRGARRRRTASCSVRSRSPRTWRWAPTPSARVDDPRVAGRGLRACSRSSPSGGPSGPTTHVRRPAADAGHRPRPDGPAALLTLDEPSDRARAQPRRRRCSRRSPGSATTGVTVLIVEQNAAQALAISDRAYVIESGSIVLEGTGADLRRRRPRAVGLPRDLTDGVPGAHRDRLAARQAAMRARRRSSPPSSPAARSSLAPARSGGCGGSPDAGPTGACTTWQTRRRCTRR